MTDDEVNRAIEDYQAAQAILEANGIKAPAAHRLQDEFLVGVYNRLRAMFPEVFIMELDRETRMIRMGIEVMGETSWLVAWNVSDESYDSGFLDQVEAYGAQAAYMLGMQLDGLTDLLAQVYMRYGMNHEG